MKDLHTTRPTVYLDQWVWIRLAQANLGRPERASHTAVLAAVRAASSEGVAFPLSATHYFETLQIKDPRQRRDLAAVMAPVSAMRTLRNNTDLLRHQFLTALHECVGRPTFRPEPPQVLGLGVNWAFCGIPARFEVVHPDGTVVRNAPREWLRHVNQYSEAHLLAGPSDEDVAELRLDGYLTPREIDDQPGNRLAWEQLLTTQLANRTISRSELRVVLLARELTHEYLDLLNRLLAEYRLTLIDIAKGLDPRESRPHAIAFAEAVPTLRIASELKLEVNMNRQRKWTWNMLSDIDALSVAIPYCWVIVADRDATAMVRRTGAPERHATLVIHEIEQLPELLDDLRVAARALAGDSTGWDQVGAGDGFRLDAPRPLSLDEVPEGCTVRFTESVITPGT